MVLVGIVPDTASMVRVAVPPQYFRLKFAMPPTMERPSSTENNKRRRSRWKAADFPYKVDYNDHFETPECAYRDIKPLMDWIHKNNNNDKDNPILYDPYYCNGATKRHLKELGYDNVIHEKRDFYQDITNQTIPNYDIFVTNPPYSEEHKIRCLQFCVQQLVERKRPFFLLLPTYVAAKHYYTKAIQGIEDSIVYLLPRKTGNRSEDYIYDHPEGTGKETSPFQSLWFCGIGKDRYQSVQNMWQDVMKQDPAKPQLMLSLPELEQLNVISTQKRPNPKQRRKRQRARQDDDDHHHNLLETATENLSSSASDPTDRKKKSKHSKYRDASGRRTKGRF